LHLHTFGYLIQTILCSLLCKNVLKIFDKQQLYIFMGYSMIFQYMYQICNY
jgi:hypothetical protein